MSKPFRRPMMPLPADLGESAEADAFNLMLYPHVRRVVTVRGFMKKNEARDALNIVLNWLLAVLGGMPAIEALDYMKVFEQIAADSIGYNLDEV